MRSAVIGGLDILLGEAATPRTRLRNAERYMTWLAGYHRKMLLDWEEYCDAHENNHPPRDETYRIR